MTVLTTMEWFCTADGPPVANKFKTGGVEGSHLHFSLVPPSIHLGLPKHHQLLGTLVDLHVACCRKYIPKWVTASRCHSHTTGEVQGSWESRINSLRERLWDQFPKPSIYTEERWDKTKVTGSLQFCPLEYLHPAKKTHLAGTHTMVRCHSPRP